MVSLNITAFAMTPTDARHFRIMSHYPNQNMVTEFNSYGGLALYKSKDDKTLVHRMSYNVAIVQVDVVKKRDKLREKCNMDWKNHDQFILKEIIQEVGCQPFYLQKFGSHKICKIKKNIIHLIQSFEGFKIRHILTLSHAKKLKRFSTNRNGFMKRGSRKT